MLSEIKELVKVINLPISEYRQSRDKEIDKTELEKNKLFKRYFFEDKLNVPIESVGFSNRTIGALKKRNYNTLLSVFNLLNADISRFDDEQYVRSVVVRLVRGQKIGQKAAEDIFYTLNQFLKEKDIKEDIDFSIDSKIENLDFSIRAYNVLKRCGYNTIEDILSFANCDKFNLSYEENIKLLESKLSACRNLGEKTCQEIVEKVEPYIEAKIEKNNDAELDDNQKKKEEAIKRFAKNAKMLVDLDMSIAGARANNDRELEIKRINQRTEVYKELER